jgi:hypothetical protein
MRDEGKLAARPPDDLAAAVVAAAEAVQLRDLAAEALPSLQRALGASNALLYRYGESGSLEGLAGSLRDELVVYTPEMIDGDPLQTLARGLAPGVKVVMVTREVDRRAYQRSDAYHLFYRPHDVEHVVCTWINGDTRYGEPGMTGIPLARAVGQDPFSERDARRIEEALPRGDRGARRPVEGPLQPGDRRAALRLGGDHTHARGAHPPQDRGRDPDAGGAPPAGAERVVRRLPGRIPAGAL